MFLVAFSLMPFALFSSASKEKNISAVCQCLLLFKPVQCLLCINESWSVDSSGSNIYWARSGWEEKHHNDRGANNSNPSARPGAASVIHGAWWRLPSRAAQPLVPTQGRAGWDFNVFLPQKAPPGVLQAQLWFCSIMLYCS